MAAITDLLDNAAAETRASKRGAGQIPTSILARIRDAGVNATWQIVAEERADGTVLIQIHYAPAAV